MPTLNRGLILLVAVCLVAAVALAQDSAADRARQATDQAIAARQQTQAKQDAWSDEKVALVARYRAAKTKVTWLAKRQSEEEAQVVATEARVAELARRLDEADRLESSMQDTLQVIYDRLADSVRESAPFLPAERKDRLASLAAELVRPDVAAGEKLRRLLEALQVEADYVATVEVYQDQIMVAGTEVHADILRVGRVALFWRTPNGDRVGTFDQAARHWTELPSRAKRSIARAVEMATRTRPVEISELPLGRIAP